MRLDVPSLVGSKYASNVHELIGGFDDQILHIFVTGDIREKMGVHNLTKTTCKSHDPVFWLELKIHEICWKSDGFLD